MSTRRPRPCVTRRWRGGSRTSSKASISRPIEGCGYVVERARLERAVTTAVVDSFPAPRIEELNGVRISKSRLLVHCPRPSIAHFVISLNYGQIPKGGCGDRQQTFDQSGLVGCRYWIVRDYIFRIATSCGRKRGLLRLLLRRSLWRIWVCKTMGGTALPPSLWPRLRTRR